MKYEILITVTENYSKTVEIEAASPHGALSVAEDKVSDGKIDITSDRNTYNGAETTYEIVDHEGSLKHFLKGTDTAFVNKMDSEEIEQLAGEIKEFLRTKEESVEGLFNPDEDDETFVVNIENL